ncbi:MAG: amino acid adenylation domain-containing protein, partial [bacterium]|nr:amino acid adenylation domain-containing protein [bacterium]
MMNKQYIKMSEETSKLTALSRGVKEPFDNSETLHGMFMKKAASMGERTALVYKDKELSYRELDRKSDLLAGVLREKGAGADTIVGLMAQRSFEMIIGLLGILKAGSAYLPIDPNYPEDRKKYMMEDSGICCLLSNCEFKDGDLPAGITVIDIGDETIYETRSEETKLPYINKSTDLLYLIYTSGSTGKPKGVMLEHRSLVNLVKFQYKYTEIDFSRVLQFTTISFDVATQEIFSTLLAGGRLYLIDNETRDDVIELFRIVKVNKIKTLFFPTAFFKFVMSETDFIGCIPDSVKHFVIAGEQLILGENAKQYLKKNQVRVHNHYGPSEAHVVTALTLEPTAELPERPSIGKPLMNTGIYILDKNLNLVPKGEVGELYIGGVQVARGYHEREKLTGEKFITLPPATGTFHESQMRLYKSGDQAKWLEDGNIEFLGRIDHQVKIRGFRVELGEIESLLLKHTGIEDAAVVLIKENEPLGNYLCAYIVPSDKDTAHSNAPSGIENATLAAEFKKYLVATLPDYMIPAHIIIMEKFPLN